MRNQNVYLYVKECDRKPIVASSRSQKPIFRDFFPRSLRPGARTFLDYNPVIRDYKSSSFQRAMLQVSTPSGTPISLI